MSSFSRKENHSILFNTIKKIYIEREHLENSSERFQILNEKLYQIWMKPQILSNINQEGYSIVDYLEELILNNELHDDYFALIISTLAKNEHFYRAVLNDQKRLMKLFNSSTSKTIYLIRFSFSMIVVNLNRKKICVF